eukprot:TRINITY_DN31946_c0_g1_i1.p1 TRINITY_DN31946_c0_g1~~TRINITY_DN31946_c0_g1_i1.p1  ORF type:complete len:914 (-),score=185.90 TRINITY_DN31946_c0_g1_i1:216-2957(-)
MHPYELSPAIVAPKPVPAPQPPGFFSQGHRASNLRVRLPEHLERLLEPYGLASPPQPPDRVILSSDARPPNTGIETRNRRSLALQSSPASRRSSVSAASSNLLKLQIVDGPTHNVQRLFVVQPVEEVRSRSVSLPALRTDSKSLSPSRKLSRQSIVGQLAPKGKGILDGHSQFSEDGAQHPSSPSARNLKTMRKGKSSPSLLCGPAKQGEDSSPAGSPSGVRKRIRINSIPETDSAATGGQSSDNHVDRPESEALAGNARARALWKRAIQLVIKDLKAKDTLESPASGPSSPSNILALAVNRKKRRLEVFKRLRDDGEIRRDNLVEALVALGYRSPNPVWVEEALVGLSEFSTLDVQEFDAFLDNYEDKWRNEGTEIFELVKDGEACSPAGRRSISCLPALLKAYDMNPLQHVLDQAVAAEGVSGYLNAVSFMRISETLQANECFTPEEAEEIKAAFRRFDFAQEGLLQDDSLASALRYLGRVSGNRAAATLASELFGEGAKNVHDFLAGVRRHQEQQDHKMRFMLRHSAPNYGTLPGGVKRLKHFLAELGHIADPNAIQDAVHESGIAQEEELCIKHLWKFLMAYTANEGVSRTDVAKAKASLEASKLRCKRLGAGEIPRAGLLAASALRGMAYAASCDLGEKLAEEVGLRKNEELELKEFLKVVRMYRELLAESAESVWNESFDIGATLHELVPEGSELLSAHTKALMGCPIISNVCDGLTKRLLARQAEGKALKWTHLAHAACSVREAMRLEMKGFYGLSSDKIHSLRDMFERATDEKREGASGGSGGGVNQLLLQLFPDLATSKSGRPTFLLLLQEEQLELNKGIGWQDFLKVARWCQELDELRQLHRQDAVVLKHSIAAEDVRELRDAFLGTRFDRTSVDLETFKEMVNKVILRSVLQCIGVRQAASG